MIRKNIKISKEDIAEKIGISKNGVKYHLKNLSKKDIVKWKGTHRNGYWDIVID